VHSDLKPHVCTEAGCDFKTRTAGNLREHQRTHSEDRKLACTECNKTFKQHSVLRTHMLTHTGERPHKCDECGQGFIKSYNLKRHNEVHHGKDKPRTTKPARVGGPEVVPTEMVVESDVGVKKATPSEQQKLDEDKKEAEKRRIEEEEAERAYIRGQKKVSHLCGTPPSFPFVPAATLSTLSPDDQHVAVLISTCLAFVRPRAAATSCLCCGARPFKSIFALRSLQRGAAARGKHRPVQG
jgi:hypothetical protein